MLWNDLEKPQKEEKLFDFINELCQDDTVIDLVYTIEMRMFFSQVFKWSLTEKKPAE